MVLAHGQPDYSSVAERTEAGPVCAAKRPLWLRLAHGVSPIVAPLLVSPFHGILSGKLMLVTVKGRRTDTVYTLPVAYHEFDAFVVALVPDAQRRSWWRNFSEPRYASIIIRGARTAAQGYVPDPRSLEFSRAAAAILRQSRLARWLYGVKLDASKQLAAGEAEKLAENTRVVVFDRTPPAERLVPNPPAPRAPESIATATPRVVEAPGPDPTEVAERRVAELIEPVLSGLQHNDRPAALALAERVAAERYRDWAKEISEPSVSALLAECAMREDDIASRVEGAVAGALSIQESIVTAYPDLAAEFLALFDGMPILDQFAFQARIERVMAETWRVLAERAPAHVRGVLLECSYLEEKSASVLDSIVAAHSQPTQ
jgi:hypothetical protein